MSRPVITARQVEDLLRSGGDVASLPSDAIYTPSALDLLRDLGQRSARAVQESAAQPPAGSLSSKSPKTELEAFFHWASCLNLKEQICEVGRRLWQRAYVDGNGGNIAIRAGKDLAICTPTLVSK